MFYIKIFSIIILKKIWIFLVSKMENLSLKGKKIDEQRIKNKQYCYDFYRDNFSQPMEYASCQLEHIEYWPSTIGLDRARNEKFSFQSFGEWDLKISMVEKSKFLNRAQFDAFFDSMHHWDKNLLGNAPVKDKITMRDVFAHLLVSLVDEDSTQGEIFDQEMIAILGGECSDDETNPETGTKICMIRDYKIVEVNGGGFYDITAQRGNFYFFIHYFSS